MNTSSGKHSTRLFLPMCRSRHPIFCFTKLHITLHICILQPICYRPFVRPMAGIAALRAIAMQLPHGGHDKSKPVDVEGQVCRRRAQSRFLVFLDLIPQVPCVRLQHALDD